MKAASDPLALIARYFEELESGNFEAAAACFADNVFYSHPPYRGAPAGSPRKEASSRAELLAQFRERGRRTVRHVYRGYVIGDRGFLSGTSTTPDGPTASFLSEFKVNADGLIDYYVAYISVPAAGSTAA